MGWTAGDAVSIDTIEDVIAAAQALVRPSCAAPFAFRMTEGALQAALEVCGGARLDTRAVQLEG